MPKAKKPKLPIKNPIQPEPATTPDKRLEFKEALPEPGEVKQKRHRRTRAEIDAEREMLTYNGFETFRDALKMFSDWDAKRFNIEEVPADTFEPIAKQYAQIFNYFMPADKNKPIYLVCGAATIQTIFLLKSRAEKIDASRPKEAPAAPVVPAEAPPMPGNTFPSETEKQHV